MKINVPLPFDHADLPDEFGTMAAVAEIGRTIEQAGFHAGLVTDHPVPTGRWLDAGGHHAQSPFVMLALLAAHTTTLRLQTGILVLPYRNPFIVARDITTLDAFAGGRVTLSVGAGYLKGEYRALGVDFDQRNELMDEYLRAIAPPPAARSSPSRAAAIRRSAIASSPDRRKSRACPSMSAAMPSAPSAAWSISPMAGTPSSPPAAASTAPPPAPPRWRMRPI